MNVNIWIKWYVYLWDEKYYLECYLKYVILLSILIKKIKWFIIIFLIFEVKLEIFKSVSDNKDVFITSQSLQRRFKSVFDNEDAKKASPISETLARSATLFHWPSLGSLRNALAETLIGDTKKTSQEFIRDAFSPFWRCFLASTDLVFLVVSLSFSYSVSNHFNFYEN